MSNKILVQTQNFFVDTSTPEIGECRNATFVLPQGLMDCEESQEMRLTLNAFSMRNNWHRINQNNQVYFIVGKNAATPPTFTSTRVQLGDGNYELFSRSKVLGTPLNRPNQSLGNNIEFGIQQSLQRTHNSPATSFATTVDWDPISGKYQITIDTSARKSGYAGGLKLVCFTIQQGAVIDQGNLAYAILNTPHHLGLVPAQPNADQWIIYMVAKASANLAHDTAAGTWSVNVVDVDDAKPPTPVNGFQILQGDYIQWSAGDPQVSYHSEVHSYEVLADKTAANVTCTIASFSGAAGSTGPSTAQIIGKDVRFLRDGGSDFIAVLGTTNRQVQFVTSTPNTTDQWHSSPSAVKQGIISGQKIAFPNDTGYTSTTNVVTIIDGGTLNATHFVMQEPYDIDFVTSGHADMHLFHDVPSANVTAVALNYNTIVITTDADSKFVSPGMEVTSSDAGLPSGTTVLSVTPVTAGGATVVLSQASTFHEQTLTVGTGTFTAGDIVDQGSGASQGTVKTTVTGTTVDVIVTVGTFGIGAADIGIQNVTVSAVAPVTRQFEYTFTTTLTATSQESSTIWTNTEFTAANKVEVQGMTVTWSGKLVNSDHVTVLSTAEYGTPVKTRVFADEIEEIPIKSSILFRSVNSGDNPSLFADSFQSTFEVLGGCYENRGKIPGADASEQFNNMRGLMEVSADIAASTYTCEAFYPATLQSEENIYLRTDVNSTAFQTAGFDTGTQANVSSSQILAKIPLNNPTFAAVNEWIIGSESKESEVTAAYVYERPFEVIYFTDNGNNEYSVMLNSKKVSSIRLFVTDKFGRLIPAVSPQQIACGGLSFTASLRIDIFETPAMPQQ